ncbi:hypothetical protein L798_13450 [Zootermopsis nevadensis]|uniref:Uncharacterized protein n=1 Tax=Zootermopsis nevadensis TaxID=136037 RepID=A0A067QYS8_ZOONE|nr:hypothetical protein L798_13450 [Zootermopsis nevadensis]
MLSHCTLSSPLVPVICRSSGDSVFRTCQAGGRLRKVPLPQPCPQSRCVLSLQHTVPALDSRSRSLGEMLKACQGFSPD